MKKFIAELIGTMILIIIGCGTAMTAGCDFFNGCGYILTALAFGLGFIAVYYSIHSISGCHINPAVSFAFFLRGDITLIELIGYVISEILGSILGSVILWVIFFSGQVVDRSGCFASNSLTGVGDSIPAGLVVEMILSFIFVLVVLRVSSHKNSTAMFGVIIGLALAGVHILGIGLTGTSVNPARSIGPALISLLFGRNSIPIKSLWVFVVGPLVGGALAFSVFSFLNSDKK